MKTHRNSKGIFLKRHYNYLIATNDSGWSSQNVTSPAQKKGLSKPPLPKTTVISKRCRNMICAVSKIPIYLYSRSTVFGVGESPCSEK